MIPLPKTPKRAVHVIHLADRTVLLYLQWIVVQIFSFILKFFGILTHWLLPPLDLCNSNVLINYLPNNWEIRKTYTWKLKVLPRGHVDSSMTWKRPYFLSIASYTAKWQRYTTWRPNYRCLIVYSVELRNCFAVFSSNAINGNDSVSITNGTCRNVFVFHSALKRTVHYI